jgi:hypothetical protein
VLEGDENTKFLHASATCRLRRNSIPSLVVEGTNFSDRSSKAVVLKDFFSDLLGTVTPVTWPFDVSSLYPGAPAIGSRFSSPSPPMRSKKLFSP